MGQKIDGPGRTGYVLALIVFLVGSVGAAILVAMFVFGLMGLGDDLERVVVPGSEQVELSETGTYTIFYEYESTVDGVDYDTGRPFPNLDISVMRVVDGTDVQVRPSLMSTSYDLTNHSGQSVRAFDVDEPGSYEISASYAGGSNGPDVVLAIGQGVARGIFTSIGAFFAAGFIFCMLTLVAVVIAGVTLYRRARANQQMVENSPLQ